MEQHHKPTPNAEDLQSRPSCRTVWQCNGFCIECGALTNGRLRERRCACGEERP